MRNDDNNLRIYILVREMSTTANQRNAEDSEQHICTIIHWLQMHVWGFSAHIADFSRVIEHNMRSRQYITDHGSVWDCNCYLRTRPRDVGYISASGCDDRASFVDLVRLQKVKKNQIEAIVMLHVIQYTYKIANTPTTHALHCCQPTYLHFCQTPNTNLLSALFIRTSFSACSFSIAAPKIWTPSSSPSVPILIHSIVT